MSGRGGSATLFMLPGDRRKPRWRAEYEKIQENFPDFQFKSRRGTDRISAVEGILSNRGVRYGVRIEVSSDYPYNIPKIVPHGWSPGNSPHIYSDGSLCVMMPSEWSSNYTISYLIAKTAIWIAKWNEYKMSGRWPGHALD